MMHPRGMLGHLYFGLLYLVAGIHLYAVLVWNYLIGETPARARFAVSRWNSLWSKAMFLAIAKAMNCRVELHLPAYFPRPLIVISNHRGLLDALLLPTILRAIGLRNNRWIVKNTMRFDPVVGVSSRAMGNAFVKRNRSDVIGDFETVRQFARAAREDGANVVLFPEGTRLRAKSDQQTLKPKTAGFSIACQELRDYDVLLLTLHWLPRARPEWEEKLHKATGIAAWAFQNSMIAHGSLIVEGRLTHVPANPAAWLESEWKLMESRLEKGPMRAKVLQMARS